MQDLLTVGELALLLRVPASWIYARTADGAVETIPHLKLGRHLRFRRSEVLPWVEGHHRGPNSSGAVPGEVNQRPQPNESSQLVDANFSANGQC
jgi:excisionase family DNA binding protein